MNKIDLKKQCKELYAPSTKNFSMVEVPALQYLMVDGKGNPNTAHSYQQAVEALYGVSYTLKFMSKNDLHRDYVVPPLEGLWWSDDMSSFTQGNKDDWRWTMMILLPDWISSDMVSEAKNIVRGKKDLPALERLKHEELYEGLCVQIMHIGSYEDEAPTLALMHNQFMKENHLSFNGKHHEIYLSDPRKIVKSKLKTVLRQPVKIA